MAKLLTGGKTDLLHKFISKKGRPFSAFLARGSDGKVSFEFAPREAKAGAKAAAKPAAAKPAAAAKVAAGPVVKPAAKKKAPAKVRKAA